MQVRLDSMPVSTNAIVNFVIDALPRGKKLFFAGVTIDRGNNWSIAGRRRRRLFVV